MFDFKLTLSLLTQNRDDEKELKIYLEEELQSHFPDLIFERLEGKVKNELKNFLDQLSVPVLIVMGAFARTRLSEFFHPGLGRRALKGGQVSTTNEINHF